MQTPGLIGTDAAVNCPRAFAAAPIAPQTAHRKRSKIQSKPAVQPTIVSRAVVTQGSSQRQSKRSISDSPRVHNETARQVHHKAADASDGANCPICINPISSSPQQTTTTRCGHSFCRSCLQKWLQQKRSCPMCKALIGHTRSSLPSGMTSDML